MASSSSLMVQPAFFGGYGRQTGIYGGLGGVEFAARCPPDVQKGTRIVAVCGIPDSRASPQEDGWFFSDFFLFHQMLNSQRTCKFSTFSFNFLFYFIDTNISAAQITSQLWLSSCAPSDLIRKHGQYVHGPANGIAGDRRVVMNEKMLPKDEMKAGFRVFKPKDLLERFLRSIAKSAASTGIYFRAWRTKKLGNIHWLC
jgi:hypothetical protein